MKNKYWFTILTPIIAAVFLLSIFSPVSAAQKPADKGPHIGVGLGNQNGNLVRFQNSGQNFEKAKQQFEDALEQFNANKNSQSKGALIQKTHDYLGSAIDRIESYIDVQKSREADIGINTFNSSSNIDAQVAQLEQLRTKMQNDSTIQELRDDNKELKDIYASISLETRYNYEIMLGNRINAFISKSDNVSAKLNAAIQNLTSKGENISKLQEISLNFAKLMQQAAVGQQNTEALLANHTGFDASGNVTNNVQAQAFLKQLDSSQRGTIKILKDAARQLQDFLREYRRLSRGAPENQQGNQEKEGKILASGNSTLVANGSGRVVINGNLTVTMSGMNGTLMASSNANVTTDGGTNQTLGNGQVKYEGFNATTITGDNIRVAIAGNNMNLTVTCAATASACNAVLNGNGTFSASGTGNLTVSGEWSKGNSITVTPPDE